MRVALLCHAPTAATRTARFPADEGIDASGLRRLARRPPRLLRHDRAFTSPALGAAETAAALGLDVIVDPALRDLDCGRWAGQGIDAVAATEPDALQAWLTDPAAAPHGGEILLDLIARVGLWLDAREGDENTIVAVTHAAVIRAAIVHALHANPRGFWRIDVAPLALATLSGGPGRWTLQSLQPPQPMPRAKADDARA